jgi:hypothetical protein
MVLIPFYHVRLATSLLLSLVAFFMCIFFCIIQLSIISCIIQLPAAYGLPIYIIYGGYVPCSKNCYNLLHTVTYCYNLLHTVTILPMHDFVGALNKGGIGHNYHHTTSTTSRVYARGSNIQWLPRLPRVLLTGATAWQLRPYFTADI